MRLVRPLVVVLTCAGLASCGQSGQRDDAGASDDAGAGNVLAIHKLTMAPNPTGLAFGFWEVYGKQAATLALMGKRPTSRVGFDAWDKIETTQGVYDFAAYDAGQLIPYLRVHSYGETALVAVNVSFSALITPGKQTIPAFYAADIGNDTTRAAAKAFLYAYVQHLLTKLGTFVLTIDYEIVSNWRLGSAGSEARASAWGAWYVEAAQTARKAAADMGMSANLKLQPIVNGNPFEPGNPIAAGAGANQWLVNAVAASDYLALDTYFSDPTLPPGNPKRTIDIIQFWIDNYSAGKPVIVTENGFNTVTEVDPTITREDRNWKTTGTEAEQAAYFDSLLTQLAAANQTSGLFHNQLRSFNIWSITDNMTVPPDNEDRYFGILHGDGTAKPAGNIVKTKVAAMEGDAFHRPYASSGAPSDVTAALTSGTGNVAMEFRNGDDFEFLRYTESKLPAATTYTLQVELASPVNVIISINGEHWVHADSGASFTFDVTAWCHRDAANTIDLYFPDGRFPARTTVRGVKLVRS